MEILSTGEKIKRARVYKGYTLRDVCEDKISVSKMSCIENNKVTPEEWVLEFISKKLDIDIDYLKQDIRAQIEENITALKAHKEEKEYQEKIAYNLEFAEKYEYYDLAFKLMHMLFNSYLDHNNMENLQVMTSRYYDICQKSYEEDNQLIYYIDMARYLYDNQEFLQAASYYENVRKRIKESHDIDHKKLIVVTYNEAACNVMLKNFERAYEIAIHLIDLLDYVDTDLKKAEMYHMLAVLCLRLNKGKFEEYEQKSYEYYKEEHAYKAQAIYNFAAVMFEVGMNGKAIVYIKKGLECYPKENTEKLVKFMILNIDALIEHHVYEEAQMICDEALNLAIQLDNIRFIERTYYYKSIILQKQGSIATAEMYMNLSLDSLVKFGTKQEIYKRYLEMGHMYHKLDATREAIKYFSLALQLEKKM